MDTSAVNALGTGTISTVGAQYKAAFMLVMLLLLFCFFNESQE